MKKTLFSSVFILSVLSIFAQPVHNYIPIPNETSQDFYEVSSQINPGGTGPNQIWDFSLLSGNKIGKIEFIDAAGTPYSSQFSTAEKTVKITITNGGFTFWSYVNYADNQIQVLGERGFVNADYYLPKVIDQYPLNYGDEVNNPYKTDSAGQSDTITIKYSAYGILKTPLGTFNNVKRFEIIDNGHAEYHWISGASNRLLMTMTTNGNDVSYYSEAKGFSTSISKNNNTASLLFPNPSAGKINLEFPDTEKREIKVFDSAGRMIKQFACAEKSFNFDLSSGVYLIRIKSSGSHENIKVLINN